MSSWGQPRATGRGPAWDRVQDFARREAADAQMLSILQAEAVSGP